MKKTRSIVVDGQRYVWRFVPRYVPAPSPDLYRCYDIFSAYLEGHHRSPLRIRFDTWECPMLGGPLRARAPVLLGRPETGGVNLHTPKWAAALIREGRRRGWEPEVAPGPFLVEDGVRLLEEKGFRST
jgi:hypothetical protein